MAEPSHLDDLFEVSNTSGYRPDHQCPNPQRQQGRKAAP
jgi:hypothetical protein